MLQRHHFFLLENPPPPPPASAMRSEMSMRTATAHHWTGAYPFDSTSACGVSRVSGSKKSSKRLYELRSFPGYLCRVCIPPNNHASGYTVRLWRTRSARSCSDNFTLLLSESPPPRASGTSSEIGNLAHRHRLPQLNNRELLWRFVKMTAALLLKACNYRLVVLYSVVRYPVGSSYLARCGGKASRSTLPSLVAFRAFAENAWPPTVLGGISQIGTCRPPHIGTDRGERGSPPISATRMTAMLQLRTACRPIYDASLSRRRFTQNHRHDNRQHFEGSGSKDIVVRDVFR